jgi:crotonobetainyl-CoA:carnitine CoA-transferase CaiB-like acyl-CoA transferase
MTLIIDLTRLSAAYGPRLLAETGHRLIRVEHPSGDDVRRSGPFMKHQVDIEHGAYHQYLNSGKESIALDTQTPDGRAILRALAGKADAVIMSRPCGFEPEWFLEANPRLAVIAVDDVPNELCAYARSGLLSITGHPGQRPTLLGGHAVLAAVGLYVAVAAAAALMAREITGQGQHVEVSSQQCMESLTEQALLTFHTTGKAPDRRGFRGAITAVSGAFQCADGYWMVSIPHDAKGWARLMDWIKDPVLMADTSLADEGQRLQKRDFILDRISDWSLKHTKDKLVTEAQARHIPASPVATVLDLAHDPQLMARGFLQAMHHPEFEDILFPVGASARIDGTAMRPAPRLGQDTAAILSELGHLYTEVRAMLEGKAT